MICGRKVKLPSPKKGDGRKRGYLDHLETGFIGHPHLPVPHLPFVGEGLVAFISFFIPSAPWLHLPVLHFPLSHFIVFGAVFPVLHFALAIVIVSAIELATISPS